MRKWFRKLGPLLAAVGILCLGIAAPVSARAQDLPAVATPAGTESVDVAISRWNASLKASADDILAASVKGDTAPAESKAFLTVERAKSKQLERNDAAQSLQQSSAEQNPAVGRRALARLERLQPMIEPILRRQGVPRALLAVVLMESGGQIDALSPKGARGLWQLMPETARRYGLEVSGERDERLDPLLATRAAARYLHDLYGEFGDWQLALAAYNAGEKAVQKAMRQAESGSFAVLSQLRLLPAETRGYVPAVLRASKAFGRLQVERASAEPNSAKGSVQFALAVMDSATRKEQTFSSPDLTGRDPMSD